MQHNRCHSHNTTAYCADGILTLPDAGTYGAIFPRTVMISVYSDKKRRKQHDKDQHECHYAGRNTYSVNVICSFHNRFILSVRSSLVNRYDHKQTTLDPWLRRKIRADDRNKIFGKKRFCYMTVHPGINCRLNIRRKCVRGHGDYRYL